MYLYNVARPVYELLDCSSVPFLGFCCQRLSVGLDPHRGVVNQLFLCFYKSDVVLLWWRSSQEAIL